jgi:lysozyme
MKKLVLGIVLVLSIQLMAVSVTLAAAPPAEPPAAPAEHGGFYHYVTHGETLFSIGRHYGVSAYDICYANNLYNCNRIYRGQSLYIPPHVYGHTPATKPVPCSTTHHVYYGETLSGIAYRYGVNMHTLAQQNGIYNYNRLFAGQKLCIY